MMDLIDEGVLEEFHIIDQKIEET